jgi:cell division septation protein DedD
MRKVLAITVALMMAAIVLMPALGYTDQSAGNQSYTATSAGRVNYSFSTGVPAHNLTENMVINKFSVHTPSVQSTRVAYSFKQGTVMPYSFNLVGVNNALKEGYQTKKAPAVLGSVAKTAENVGVPAQATAPAAAATATNVTAAPAVTTTAANVTVAPVVVAPKFTIEGMAFNDMNGNGTMDNNETGLADWTVNLEQPAGMVVMNANTTMDGKFVFSDLSAGEYVVSEVLKTGYKLVSPADGKFTENITDKSVTGLVFANQAMPVAAENATVTPSVIPSNVTAPVNTTPINTTSA